MASLVISVSAGVGIYRHIQISERATLFELHSAILDSFDFEDGHMHSFFMNNVFWDESEEYTCRSEDDVMTDAKGLTDEIKLSSFRLKKGDKFAYIYDFGDEWSFNLRVLRVVDEETKDFEILKAVGEINQYWDEWDDYDEDEDDEGSNDDYEDKK